MEPIDVQIAALAKTHLRHTRWFLSFDARPSLARCWPSDFAAWRRVRYPSPAAIEGVFLLPEAPRALSARVPIGDRRERVAARCATYSTTG